MACLNCLCRMRNMAIVNKLLAGVIFLSPPPHRVHSNPLGSRRQAGWSITGEVACALIHRPAPGTTPYLDPHTPLGWLIPSSLPGDSWSLQGGWVASLLCDPVSLLLPKEEQSLFHPDWLRYFPSTMRSLDGRDEAAACWSGHQLRQ